VDARLSRYSYLVSLLPRALVRDLGLRFETGAARSPLHAARRGRLLVDAADRRARRPRCTR
jgi:hypothetical protein